MTNIFVDDILFICVVSLSFVFHIISPFVRIFPLKKYSFALRICFDMAKFGRCINWFYKSIFFTMAQLFRTGRRTERYNTHTYRRKLFQHYVYSMYLLGQKGRGATYTFPLLLPKKKTKARMGGKHNGAVLVPSGLNRKENVALALAGWKWWNILQTQIRFVLSSTRLEPCSAVIPQYAI